MTNTYVYINITISMNINGDTIMFWFSLTSSIVASVSRFYVYHYVYEVLLKLRQLL